MKVIKFILITLVVLIAVVLFGKDLIAKFAVETGVKMATGLPLKVEKLHVGLRHTLIDIEGLRIYNPDGFPEPMMADLPKIYVDYHLGNILGGTIHLEDVKLYLEEFVVVKNAEGRVNLDFLKPVQKEEAEEKVPEKPADKPEAAKPMGIQIDSMELKIGRVVYKDYSGGRTEPVVREYPINLHEEFHHLDSLDSVVRIVLVKALSGTALHTLTDINISALSDSVSGALAGSETLVRDFAGDMAGQLQAAGMKLNVDTLSGTAASAGNVLKSAGSGMTDAASSTKQSAEEAAAALKDKAKSLTSGLKSLGASLGSDSE